MPKKFFKRWMPNHETVRNHKSLQFLGTLLHDPNLFHLNRKSVPGAFSIGLFCAFIPVPFQMAIAAVLAIWSRVNLPISVGLVWLTNPVTMPPVFYFCYKLGTWLLGMPAHAVKFEVSLTWLISEIEAVGAPLLFGSLVTGAVCAVTANLLIRLIWRLAVARTWQARSKRRRQVGLKPTNGA